MTAWYGFLYRAKDYTLINKETDSFKNYKPEERNLNTSKNFSDQLSTIVEDKDGLIWVGTTEWLNSYNKKTDRFTQYKHDPDNPDGLSNNNVWSVLVDREGLIWIGTKDGLNCYNKDTDKFYRYRNNPDDSNSISSNQIQAICWG